MEPGQIFCRWINLKFSLLQLFLARNSTVCMFDINMRYPNDFLKHSRKSFQQINLDRVEKYTII
jgi:hypothetical protein